MYNPQQFFLSHWCVHFFFIFKNLHFKNLIVSDISRVVVRDCAILVLISNFARIIEILKILYFYSFRTFSQRRIIWNN